jgi:hypothetical protein
LIDNKNVIHRAFVGSLQGRQDVFDESFALSVRAMKGLSSAPSCPDPKACVAKEPPIGPEGGKVDWRQLLDELRRQGGLLAALQESLKRLEENQNKAPQPGAPIPDLTAQLTSIQGQLQRNEQDLSRVRSQAEESRRASWYQMGGLAALLLGALSGLLFWLERRRGAARA